MQIALRRSWPVLRSRESSVYIELNFRTKRPSQHWLEMSPSLRSAQVQPDRSYTTAMPKCSLFVPSTDSY